MLCVRLRSEKITRCFQQSSLRSLSRRPPTAEGWGHLPAPRSPSQTAPRSRLRLSPSPCAPPAFPCCAWSAGAQPRAPQAIPTGCSPRRTTDARSGRHSPTEHTAASSGQPLTLPPGSSLWQIFMKKCFLSVSFWLPTTASQFCSGSVKKKKKASLAKGSDCFCESHHKRQVGGGGRSPARGRNPGTRFLGRRATAQQPRHSQASRLT